MRKRAEGEVTCDLFGFLTTAANAEVGRYHPKVMPVILTEPSEWNLWLSSPWAEASRLQRSLPDRSLVVVARGEKADGDGDRLTWRARRRTPGRGSSTSRPRR